MIDISAVLAWKFPTIVNGISCKEGEIFYWNVPQHPQLPTNAEITQWQAEYILNLKQVEIKRMRNKLMSEGGYQVGTKWFHSDNFSRSQQIGLILLGTAIPANTQWKTMDGSFVLMTQTLVNQILDAAAASDIAIFNTAEAHLAALNTSASPELYDYSTGWPTTFLSI